MSQQVELLGHYGGDLTHALSAWTSTHRDLDPERKLRIPKLLALLAEGSDGNEHGTPFEKSMLHFLVRVDTASHIHILKHRIGVSVNGESARYKKLAEPTCHIPEDWPEDWQNALAEHYLRSRRLYVDALYALEPTLGRKRAKESARFFLPYANQLNLDVSFNFRSFAAFQKLRNAPSVQREIREIAQEMLELVRDTGDFDHSLEAFGLL